MSSGDDYEPNDSISFTLITKKKKIFFQTAGRILYLVQASPALALLWSSLLITLSGAV